VLVGLLLWWVCWCRGMACAARCVVVGLLWVGRRHEASDLGGSVSTAGALGAGGESGSGG
jgi:hypothetical protein